MTAPAESPLRVSEMLAFDALNALMAVIAAGLVTQVTFHVIDGQPAISLLMARRADQEEPDRLVAMIPRDAPHIMALLSLVGNRCHASLLAHHKATEGAEQYIQTCEQVRRGREEGKRRILLPSRS